MLQVLNGDYATCDNVPTQSFFQKVASDSVKVKLLQGHKYGTSLTENSELIVSKSNNYHQNKFKCHIQNCAQTAHWRGTAF